MVSSMFTRAAAPPYTSLGNDTLLEALGYSGRSGVQGGAQILLRAGVAAVLNATEFGSDYPYSVAQITAEVNAALDSQNRTTMLTLAAKYDAANNSTNEALCSQIT